MPLIRSVFRLLPAVGLFVSCGGGDLVLPSEGEPAAVTIAQGDGQSGRAGSALADPVVARVTDSQGRPVGNVRVAFAFTGGIAATVAPDTAVTDADGRASFQVVLGTEVGEGGAEARVITGRGQRTLDAPVTFTALGADANELVAISGDSQSAPVGTALPSPLVVQVTDAFGNPVAGVDVTWAAVDGGSVSQATVPTGPDGFSSVSVTLGPGAGIQRTTASAPGLAGSPVSFIHIALPGSPTTLEQVSGDGQSAVVGTALPDPLVVRARDAGGNPVAGLGVTWVVTTGGGSVVPQSGTTGPDGLASTVWTLGPVPGANAVTAVVSGVGTVGFSATGNAGAPPGMTVEVQPPASAVRGVKFSRAPVIQLREPDGSVRARSGVPVTVGLTGAGGVLRGTLTRTTGPDGRAEFRDLAIEGPAGTYGLAFSAPGHSGVASDPIALARAPTTIEITADDPDPSVAGASVRVAFRVRSPGGTPAGPVQVSADDGSSCSASASDGACSVALTGVGSRTITAAYGGSPEFEGSTDTEAHEVRAPAPPVLALVAQPPATAVVGAAFTTDPVVQLREAGGADQRIPGVVVTVAIESGRGTLGGTTTSTTGGDGRAAFPGLSIGGATGRHTLRFSADGYTPVTSDPIEVQAAPPAPTTTAITADDPDPSDVGQAVLVRYSVTSSAGTPTGPVTISASGGSETCSASVAAGSCSIELVVPGSRTLTASYAGGGGFAASSGTGAHTVVQPPAVPDAGNSSVAAADATIPVGGTTQVTVTVRDAGNDPLAGIAVTLAASGTGNTITPPSATTGGNGVATFTFGAASAGDRTLIATAGGITLAQQPTVSVQRSTTTTAIVSDGPDPSSAGQAVTVEFTVAGSGGTPTGTVTVTASSGESCPGPVTLAAGGGSCTLTLNSAGGVTLTAAYGGDDDFAPSSDSEGHTVVAPSLELHKQPSSTATSGVAFEQQPEVDLVDPVGSQAGVTVTAELASGAGSLSGSPSAVTGGNGRAVFSDLGITGPPGAYTIRFSADGFAPVTSNVITVQAPPPAATTTTITSDEPDPSPQGGDVTVAFTVSSSAGTPAGTVLVSASSGESCPGPVTLAADGTGSCTLTLNSAGGVTLSAQYGGGDGFAPSTGTADHTVSAAP